MTRERDYITTEEMPRCYVLYRNSNFYKWSPVRESLEEIVANNADFWADHDGKKPIASIISYDAIRVDHL